MKNKKFSSPAPERHSVVSPHLLAEDVGKELEFFRTVFDAEMEKRLADKSNS